MSWQIGSRPAYAASDREMRTLDGVGCRGGIDNGAGDVTGDVGRRVGRVRRDEDGGGRGGEVGRRGRKSVNRSSHRARG